MVPLLGLGNATGEKDLVLALAGMTGLLPALPKLVRNLKLTRIPPGCGHWTQQERPQEVNAAMIDFLKAELRL